LKDVSTLTHKPYLRSVKLVR